jgi:hypothetical protein
MGKGNKNRFAAYRAETALALLRYVKARKKNATGAVSTRSHAAHRDDLAGAGGSSTIIGDVAEVHAVVGDRPAGNILLLRRCVGRPNLDS